MPMGTGATAQLDAPEVAAVNALIAAAPANVSQLDSFNVNNATFPAANAMGASSRNRHPVLTADDTVNEAAVFNRTMSQDYSAGNVLVDVDWVSDATVGDVVLGVRFERSAPGGQDIDSDSFAAQQTGTETTAGTSGVKTRTTIALTQAEADSIAAADGYRLEVERVATDGDDDLVGDIEITGVGVRQ